MRIFLSTHGKMASGMKSSLEILLGDTSCMAVYDAYLPGETSTVAAEVEKFLADMPEEEVKVLVSDIKGGSVNQQMMQFMDRNNVVVISGVNLALLMSLVLAAENDLSVEEIDEMAQEARETVGRVVLDNKIEMEDFF